MSSTTHNITLTARDGISRTFNTIGREGDQMARQLVTDMQRVERATEQTGRQTETFSRRMAALGTVVATAAGFLSDAARASEESAQIQRQLEQAIQNTGEAYSTYADRIDEASQRAVQLGIDDEKAAQALQALTETTHSAETALDLLGLAEDIAAAKNMDLVTAAELVGKVHEGNVGILKRYGIVVQEGASAEEALAQIQQQVAGQAEAHATTIDRLKVEYGNLQEKVGGAAGELAPFIGMLPGLSVGFSALGTVVGGLSAALGPAGLVLAAGAAAFAIYELTKSEDENVAIAKAMQAATIDLTSTLNALAASGSPLAQTGAVWRDALKGAISEMATLQDLQKDLERTTKDLDDRQRELVGTTGKQQEAIKAEIENLSDHKNALEQQINAAKDAANAEEALNRVLLDTGTGAKLAQDEVEQLFKTYGQDHNIVALIEGLVEINRHLGDFDAQANEAAQSADEFAAAQEKLAYATGRAVAQSAEHMAALHAAAAQRYKDAYDQAHAETALGKAWAESMGAMAAFADNLSHISERARDTRSNFDRLAAGSTSAAVALGAFKDVQDGLLASESVYSGQLSEYNSQLNAIQAALDIIHGKQEDGIALSEREQRIVDNSTDAQARLEGGVEDATYAMAEQAEQYGDNMSKGDQLNRSLDGVSQTTGELTDAIYFLIASLNDVPGEVKTNIHVDGIETAIQGAKNLKDELYGIPTYIGVNVVSTYTDVGKGSHGMALGGKIGYDDAPHAALGRALRGPTWVGEFGPELFDPVGRTVWPHASSKMSSQGKGGGDIVITGPITIVANNPRQFARQLSQHRRMELQ